jgi:hypothetical protein
MLGYHKKQRYYTRPRRLHALTSKWMKVVCADILRAPSPGNHFVLQRHYEKILPEQFLLETSSNTISLTDKDIKRSIPRIKSI